MDLTYGDRFGDLEVPDAYTRLILDVLRGKQATFVRDDELEAAWAIFSPLLHELESSSERPLPYTYGSRGPPEADEFISQFYTRSQSYIWKGKDYGSMSDSTPDKSSAGSSKM